MEVRVGDVEGEASRAKIFRVVHRGRACFFFVSAARWNRDGNAGYWCSVGRAGRFGLLGLVVELRRLDCDLCMCWSREATMRRTMFSRLRYIPSPIGGRKRSCGSLKPMLPLLLTSSLTGTSALTVTGSSVSVSTLYS